MTEQTTTATVDPIKQGLHEAGWYARADLDPATVDGIVSDVLDLVREQLTSEAMARHIENWVPLGFDPIRDPYPTITDAARAILAETAENITRGDDAFIINGVYTDRSAGRWCDTCDQHGTHHTDQHDGFLAAARAEN